MGVLLHFFLVKAMDLITGPEFEPLNFGSATRINIV
jgi:hypothetical protein